MLAGLLVACVGLEVVSVVALGRPVDVDGIVEACVFCAAPLFMGYGIGRGLASLGRGLARLG